MSIPPVSSLGRYPDAIVNNSAPAKTEKPGEQAKLNTADRDRLEKEATAAIREGRSKDIVMLSKEQGGFTTGGSSGFDGKTVINNKGLGLIIGSLFTADGKEIITSSDANKASKNGAPTHGFFYSDFDFLTEAAKEYSTLGENEVFQYRNIDDVNLIRDSLDFFTNGNYTGADVNAVQDQMTNVVKELAQQLKNGESLDFSKLESKLTMGGADVTISQLMDFQKVGGELKESFDGITTGSWVDTLGYSKMGVAKAVGNYYGNDKGEIGKKFSSAMDRLYERGVVQYEQRSDNPFYSESKYSDLLLLRGKDGVGTGLNIANTFSTLDFSSKESFSKDFASKLSSVRSLVQNHCEKFGVSTSHIGLAGDTADTIKYFQSWMDKI